MILFPLLSLCFLTTAFASESFASENVSNYKEAVKHSVERQHSRELFVAIKFFQVEEVRKIIEKCPILTESYEANIMCFYFPLFCKDHRFGHKERIEMLDALEPCLTNPPNSTALIDAIKAKYYQGTDFVGLLNLERLDVNQCDDYGRTPLILACMHKDVQMAKKILAFNPDRNVKAKNGMNALHHVLHIHNLKVLREMFELLLDESMKLSSEDLFYILPVETNDLAKRIQAAGGVVVINYERYFLALCIALVKYSIPVGVLGVYTIDKYPDPYGFGVSLVLCLAICLGIHFATKD